MTEITRPVAAWWNFQMRVEARGGVVLEHEWLGNRAPHRVRCAAGHDCAPRPNNVQQGEGVCRVCAGTDPQAAEQTFRSRVAELGGEVIEPVWLGDGVPHRVLCSEGHLCTPHPTNIHRGTGICRTCAGLDPVVAEAAFRERVAKLGGVILEPVWLGVDKAHLVRCAAGHSCAPSPSNVRRGQGLCGKCAGHNPDAFYVVSGVDRVTGMPTVKPGITVRDGRARLGYHATSGLRTEHGLWTGLADGVARKRELALLACLAAEGWKPTRGEEYFPLAALPIVLAFVAEWLSSGVR